MKYPQLKMLVPILILLFFSCNLFEPEEEQVFITFKTTVGGNGYDLINDMIEREDAYVLAGVSGPQCDIVDAFMAKVDKEDGSRFSFKTFGNPNQGFEENFFAIDFLQGKFRAVGFALEPLPPTMDNPFNCSRDTGDIDGQLFYGTLNENFSDPFSRKLEPNTTNKWESGFDLLETPDGRLLVAGSLKGFITVKELQGDTVAKEITSDDFVGDGAEILEHSSGRIFLAGEYRSAATFFNTINVYLGELDLGNEQLINEVGFDFLNDGGWDASDVNAMEELPNGNLLLSGTLFKNNPSERLAFFMEVNLSGDRVNFRILPELGMNSEVQDMIKVEDGFILVGGLTKPEVNNSDVLMLKIDFNGTVLWSELHDFRGNDDTAKSVIQTLDGGFLLGGQTDNDNDDIRTMLLIKTDARGQVE